MSQTLMLSEYGEAMLWSDDSMAWAKRLGYQMKAGPIYVYPSRFYGRGFIHFEPAPLLLTYRPMGRSND